MYKLKPVFFVLFIPVFVLGQPKDDTPKHSGKIERTYVSPKQIVWQSPGNQVENSERLFKLSKHQSATVNNDLCLLKNQGSIVLDFGRELHGGLEIVTGMWPGNMPVNVRVRFGESVSETNADIGENGATNDHAIRDWKLQLPWCGKIEIGNTGFRFVRIDLLDEKTTLHLREVNAISVMRDIPYLGSFKSSDERLNEIWETGAYTVHLNMQEYLWDGIKRDRLVWVGDMHPEVRTILSVFGTNEVVPKSLDFISEITPSSQWMNGISSYSMWWLIIQHDYYMHSGDIAYLSKHKSYIYSLLEKLENNIDKNGKEKLDGHRFLDWPTSDDQQSIHAGLQSMMVMTFEAAIELATIFNDEDKADHYKKVALKLKNYMPEVPGRKSPAALLALSGLSDANSINNELLIKDGVKDISTFYGYYVLNAMAKAGNYSGAMDFISEYWGAMLDLGATSFWEDFNIDWTKNAGRIDEIVADDKVDVHATYGDYCYEGLRHSLCHGWASGPTAWMTEYVLGVKVMEAGCAKVKIEPHLGDLKWVEGSYPTPKGVIKIRHEKLASGEIKSDIDMPAGIVLME